MIEAHALAHGAEKAVLGDAGYRGVAKRPSHVGLTGSALFSEYAGPVAFAFLRVQLPYRGFLNKHIEPA
ncbi:hypothetical protein F2P44_31155 [Massilia sp. CCM 8695]|uniref:Transposase n=1 Tax=Massilia frigida TaxID=2609281 RepID=A0ABX0NJ36_9BURK|nr:hypothetical protein [Massilia frigida]